MTMNIAPSGAVPIGAAPATMPATSAQPAAIVPTAGSVPAILQPATGVSGGGPTADLQAALEGLWSALGALKGALASLQQLNQPPVAGGGPGGCRCGCQQAAAGAGAMGAPTAVPAQAPAGGSGAPTSAPASSAPAPTNDWKASKGTKLKHPVPGSRESSQFGEVAAVRNHRPHSGLDFAIDQGTPIVAAARGRVSEIGFSATGMGHYVVIDHGNGYVTKYGHMVEKPSVKKDDVVDAGTQIGKVGSTGNSTGPHLHFMVVKGGANQDPKPYIDGKLTLG